jgi:hypothetical protein
MACCNRGRRRIVLPSSGPAFVRPPKSNDGENKIVIATTTPSGINKHVRTLRDRIASPFEPVFLQVKTRADARSAECFEATANHVAELGGSSVVGWQVWEWPGILIEGEFHAVWKSPDGELLDVSRKDEGEQRILFIPDPRIVYHGEAIDSIRIPIGKDPKIKQLISTKERFYRLFKEVHGNATGMIVLTGDLADLHTLSERLGSELAVSREALRALALSSRRQR